MTSSISVLRPIKNWVNSMAQEVKKPSSRDFHHRHLRHSRAGKKPTGAKIPMLASIRNITHGPRKARQISCSGVSWRVWSWRLQSTGGNSGTSPRSALSQWERRQKPAGNSVSAASPAQNITNSSRPPSRQGPLTSPRAASRLRRRGSRAKKAARASSMQGSISRA